MTIVIYQRLPHMLISGPHPLDDRLVVVIAPLRGRHLTVDLADVEYLGSGPDLALV